MNKNENPYEILGLSPGVDESSIKKAYFKLAKKCHPDKQKTDKAREEATSEFAKIADAYDLLSDPVRRHDWRISQEDMGPKKIASTSYPDRKMQTVVPPMRSSNPPRHSVRVSTVPAGRAAMARPSCMMRPATVRSAVPMPSLNRHQSGPQAATVRSSAPMPSLNRHQSGPQAATVRSSAPMPAPTSLNRHESGGRSPMRVRNLTNRNSGGRSPNRNSGGRSPNRNSGGRSPNRNSGGRSPARNGVGRSQTIQSPVRRPHSLNKPHPLNGNSRPMDRVSRIDQQDVQQFRPVSPGRRKGRGNSLGRKPKNSLDALSDHGPRVERNSGERRRRLKKNNSFRSGFRADAPTRIH